MDTEVSDSEMEYSETETASVSVSDSNKAVTAGHAEVTITS